MKGCFQRKETWAAWGKVPKYPSFPKNYGTSCPRSPSLFDLLSSLLETNNINQRWGVQGSPVSTSLSDLKKSQLTIRKLVSRSAHAGGCDNMSSVSQHPAHKSLRSQKIMWKTEAEMQLYGCCRAQLWVTWGGNCLAQGMPLQIDN